MESPEYVIINKTTNAIVFRGKMDMFKTLSAMVPWVVPEEFIKNWAAVNNCEVFERI